MALTLHTLLFVVRMPGASNSWCNKWCADCFRAKPGVRWWSAIKVKPVAAPGVERPVLSGGLPDHGCPELPIDEYMNKTLELLRGVRAVRESKYVIK